MLKHVGLGTWIVEKCRVREHGLLKNVGLGACILKNVGLGAWIDVKVRVRSMDCWKIGV